MTPPEGLHPVRLRMVETFGGADIDHIPATWSFRIRFDEFDHSREAAYFLQAMDRIRAVTFAAFGRSTSLTAILHWASGVDSRSTPPFEDLEALGLHLSPTPDEIRPAPSDPDDPPSDFMINTRFLVLKPDLESLAPLLVQAVVPWRREGGYTNLWFELVDFERGIVIEYYNNSGMLVLGATAEAVLPIYERYRDWIYEYEQERADALFGPLVESARPRLSVVEQRP